MRTTLTLDSDVVRLIEHEVRRVRRPFKQVVDDAIRRGLTPPLADAADESYRVKAHQSVLGPGVDPAAFNRLVDELDDEVRPLR